MNLITKIIITEEKKRGDGYNYSWKEVEIHHKNFDIELKSLGRFKYDLEKLLIITSQ